MGDGPRRRLVMRVRHTIRSIALRRRKNRDRETALVVLVPAAEKYVLDMRRRPKTIAMPAHITVLYPFVQKSSLTTEVVARLRRTFLAFEPFTFELTEVEWFEERVVYLRPSPSATFQEMSQLLTDAFPNYKPYRGAFTEIVPHLTLAESASPSKLRAAADSLAETLPIHGHANAVCLMAQDTTGNWDVHTIFPLGH